MARSHSFEHRLVGEHGAARSGAAAARCAKRAEQVGFGDGGGAAADAAGAFEDEAAQFGKDALLNLDASDRAR